MAIAGGRHVGPYELIEPIGHGGSAVVYRAYDAAQRRDVAVKVISGAHASDPTFRARFRQEADLISRLGHPHILAVLDSGETSSAPGAAFGEEVAYLVTEYMAGGNLAGRVANLGAVRERALIALAIAEQIGAALDWAHAAGVLHRDVKPSNVLIAANGRYVLGDFGLARVLQSGASLHLTATGLVAGTPAYMAPEQALGQPADARTDLYSLGVVLYEVLTGRVPFDAESPMAVMLAHVHQPPPLPSEVAAGVPDAISSVILSALAKEREARPENAAQLASLLHAAVAQTYGESSITTGTFALLPPTAHPDLGSVVAVRASAASSSRVQPAPRERAARRSQVGRNGRRPVPAQRRRDAGWRVPVLIAGFVAFTALLATGAGAVALGPGRPRLAGLLNRYIQDSVPLGVSEALPRDLSRNQPLRPSISIRFNQPMDQDSVQAAFHLETADTHREVPVDFQWEGQMLQVVPREDLAYGTTYYFVVETTAHDLDGRELGGTLERHFATAAEPPKPVNVAVAAPAAPPTSAPTDSPRPAPTDTQPPRPAPTTGRSAPAAAPPTATLYTPPTVPPAGPDQLHVAGLLIDANGSAKVLDGSDDAAFATPGPDSTSLPQPSYASVTLPAPATAVPASPTAASTTAARSTAAAPTAVPSATTAPRPSVTMSGPTSTPASATVAATASVSGASGGAPSGSATPAPPTTPAAGATTAAQTTATPAGATPSPTAPPRLTTTAVPATPAGGSTVTTAGASTPGSAATPVATPASGGPAATVAGSS